MRTNPVLDELGAYPITEIQDTARRMRDAGERLIDFSIGDPREPTPEFIRQRLKDTVPTVTQYPQTTGLAALRDAIAGYCRRRYGAEVDPATQVMPASGAKEAIFSTPFAFVKPGAGDLVAWGTPTYPVYERGARFAGAEVLPIVLGGDFVLRVDDVPTMRGNGCGCSGSAPRTTPRGRSPHGPTWRRCTSDAGRPTRCS